MAKQLRKPLHDRQLDRNWKQFQIPRLAILLAVLLPAYLFAQSARGSLTGLVKDATDAVIAGASVSITNAATNLRIQLQSNSAGEYTAASLEPGDYTVRVERQGFRTAVIRNVLVNVGANLRTDVTLEVGTTQQEVEVKAEALQLQTEDARTTSTVTNKMVDQLPLVVGGALRSAFDLAALTPEAKNVGGDTGFRLGGGQAGGYTATLDGVSANATRTTSRAWVISNTPSLDAITEFTVETNGFKAEYGHSSGGVMTFVSKSGTNSPHGSAYEFLRNNVLDANYFFSNTTNQPRPIYKQHDFGGSFGGPVWLPKLYNGRDKSFFFFAYEGFRNRAGATSVSTTVPTPEMYKGDFSSWVDAAGRQIPIYDPVSQVTNADGSVTRLPFQNNQIPQSLFDPIALQGLTTYQQSAVLAPNNGAAPGTSAYVRNNYLVSRGSMVNPVNKWSLKGDHNFSANDRVSVYFGRNRSATKAGPDGAPSLPGLYTGVQDTYLASDVWRGSWDHVFSPTKMNHFYLGRNKFSSDSYGIQEAMGNWRDKFCLPNVPDCNVSLGMFAFSEYTGWGSPALNGAGNVITGFHDDFSWVKGAHSIKFGGMFQRSEYNGYGYEYIAGRSTFSFLQTGRPGDTNFTTAGGSSFASFLLGYANAGSIMTPRYIGQNFPYVAGYIQDDWRISRRLVLNVGLRWENQFAPYEPNGNFSDFSPILPNPAAGGIPGAVLFAGSGTGRTGSRSLADSYYGAWGPRFAFSYSLADKTVLRASYGRTFSQVQASAGSTHLMGLTLIQDFANGSNGLQPTYRLRDGMPAWTEAPFIDPSVSNGNVVTWWQNNEISRPPELNNFNFSVQHQLSSSTVLEASYNGVVGSHLQTSVLNYNQVDPRYLNQYGAALLTSPIDSPQAVAAGIRAPFPGFGTLWGARATVAQALRPFPQYSDIDTWIGNGDHSGHSTYHAGIVKLEKRFSRGFTIQTSYVFSKLLTDSDSYAANAAYRAADHYNRRLEKSIGQFDVTHDFKFAGIFELPFGKGHRWLNSGFASAVLGNWRLSTIALYASGLPVGITTTVTQPLFAGRNVPYIASNDGWQPSWSGDFDPSTNRFFVPYGSGPFLVQGPGTSYSGIGNATRYNPKVRQFPNLTENLSVAKTFPINEKIVIDFRAEAFNAFNRVRFGTGSTQLQAPTFGQLTSNGDLLNTPRQLQFAMKLSF